MKKHLLSLVMAVSATGFSQLQAQDAAPAKLSPLQVAVEVENVSRDRGENTRSETKRLKITIQNPNKEAVAGKLNWKMLGRDIQSRDLKAVGGDVAQVNLAPGESKVVEGAPVVFTEKEGKTTGKPGKKGSKPKTTPDTGVDYKGYFVEINDAKDTVIGSAYSPGMKDDARDLYVRPASKPAPKKKK